MPRSFSGGSAGSRSQAPQFRPSATPSRSGASPGPSRPGTSALHMGPRPSSRHESPMRRANSRSRRDERLTTIASEIDPQETMELT